MSDRIETLFANRGLRCTKQRKALYRALANSRAHPTADELHQLVRAQEGEGERARGISLATVYNTLEAFCQSGLAQKLSGAGANGSARYDAVRGDHLHMRCQRTGRVEDVPAELSRRVLDRIPSGVLRELERELGFKIDQVQIELVGRYERGRRQPRQVS